METRTHGWEKQDAAEALAILARLRKTGDLTFADVGTIEKAVTDLAGELARLQRVLAAQRSPAWPGSPTAGCELRAPGGAVTVPTTTYTVEFERIGSGHRGLRRDFVAEGPEDTHGRQLVDQIHVFLRPRLAPRDCNVTFDPDTGEGLLAWGRSGRFTATRQDAPAAP